MIRWLPLVCVAILTGCPSGTTESESSRSIRLARDAALCEQLRAVGSDVRVPHRLEHQFYAQTRTDAQTAVQKAKDTGYSVTEIGQDFSFVVYTDTVPEAETVSAVTTKMVSFAHAYRLEYDGWGTEVVPK